MRTPVSRLGSSKIYIGCGVLGLWLVSMMRSGEVSESSQIMPNC